MGLSILIADDHDVVRRGLKSILQAHPGWEVCAEALNGREAVELAKKLKPHVVVLDTVVATAKRAFGIMRGFEERRAMGIGYFVTREDLEKRQSWRMSEVISQIPGANILRTGAGHAYVSSSHPSTSLGPGGRASVCLAVIFLDGMKVYAGRRGEPPFDINSVQALELEGVEYYAGGAEAPAQYSGQDTSCGVLLMWTRISP